MNLLRGISFFKNHLDVSHMTSPDGPELEVYAEHDEAWEEEGDAGGGDGVLRTEVEPAGQVHHCCIVHLGWSGEGHVHVARNI